MSRTAFALTFALAVAAAHEARAGDLLKPIHRQGATPLDVLFKKELADAKARHQGVVVMFSADWCTPCKVIKQWLHESRVVQKAASRGHLLLIDVDEWRGPAHALIPGVNPTKLPMIVRTDYDGKAVVTCYGTDLGILSEEDTAANLARLIDGKPPAEASYAKDPAKERELAVAGAKKEQAEADAQSPLDVRVTRREDLDDGLARWTLHLTLRNRSAIRRWFALTGRVGQRLTEQPRVAGWTLAKFTEHVRAVFFRFRGAPEFVAVPVNGHGSVELGGWTVEGLGQNPTFEVWELEQLTLDGKPAQMEQKLPYALQIKAAGQATSLGDHGPGAVVLKPAAKRSVVLE